MITLVGCCCHAHCHIHSLCKVIERQADNEEEQLHVEKTAKERFVTQHKVLASKDTKLELLFKSTLDKNQILIHTHVVLPFNNVFKKININ